MDLMATDTSVQWIPGVGRDADRALPFYSRYHTAGTAGVSVLDQDVSHMPGSANACFGFCFPPPRMVAVVLQHMQGCKARAVVVVRDDRQSWLPLLAAATVRSVPVAAKGGAGTFFPYTPPERESVVCFPAVGYASRRGGLKAGINARRQTGSNWYTGRCILLRGIDLRQTGIAHPTPLVSLPPPHVHLCQAIGHLLRLICTILPVVLSLLSSLCAGQSIPTSAPTLVHVAVAMACFTPANGASHQVYAIRLAPKGLACR